MAEERTTATIICSPATEESLIPGAVKEPCAECGQLVWVGPSAATIPGKKRLICKDCFLAEYPVRELEIEPPTEAQIEELSKATGMTRKEILANWRDAVKWVRGKR